jgi:hypothetical protein
MPVAVLLGVKPLQRIRRFDVFAEYRKQEAQDDGMKADEARGYGLWVAKVVAARKFGRLKSSASAAASPEEQKKRRRRKWKVLGGQPQTDKLFEHQIVDRMGPEFYRQVFVPAIKNERDKGHSYEDIRDRLRRRWKPLKAA